MLDLFCGRGGWTNAFLERGWDVIGVDIIRNPEYRGRFIQCDVMNLEHRGDEIFPFDFGCVSSPCEEFAVFGMAHFHPKPKYPKKGIDLFNHARWLMEEAGVPYIMENVREARKFIGEPVSYCGPFYLWGNAVPPLLPQGITKGFGAWDRKYILTTGSSKSKKRQELKAKWATIPPELAACVADYAERILNDSRSSGLAK